MTKLPVRRTSRAEEDLIEIWQYIAYDSPRSADRLLDMIDERLQQLSHMPQLAPLREDLGSEIRALVIRNYIAFYRVAETEISVLRVMDGRRDIRPDDLEG